MKKGIFALLLLLPLLFLAACGEKEEAAAPQQAEPAAEDVPAADIETDEAEAGEDETDAKDTSDEEDIAETEFTLVPWFVGNASFSVPAGAIPQNMVEEGTEYCAYENGGFFIMASATPLRGLFSFSDFDAEEASAYLEELAEPDENGYAPQTAELVMAGEHPYCLLGYAYDDGSWASFHTILDGVAYTFTGWRPGEQIAEEDIQYLWGTAATLEAVSLETEVSE